MDISLLGAAGQNILTKTNTQTLQLLDSTNIVSDTKPSVISLSVLLFLFSVNISRNIFGVSLYSVDISHPSVGVSLPEIFPPVAAKMPHCGLD